MVTARWVHWIHLILVLNGIKEVLPRICILSKPKNPSSKHDLSRPEDVSTCPSCGCPSPSCVSLLCGPGSCAQNGKDLELGMTATHPPPSGLRFKQVRCCADVVTMNIAQRSCRLVHATHKSERS